MKKLILLAVLIAVLLIPCSALAQLNRGGLDTSFEATEPSPAEIASNEAARYRTMSDYATVEAFRPAYLVLDDTAYLNHIPFESFVFDFGNQGNSEWKITWGYSPHLNFTYSLFNIFNSLGYGLGLKINVLEESNVYPAFSIAAKLKTATVQNSGQVNTYWEGGEIRFGSMQYDYLTFNESVYQLLLSKTIGDSSHIHFGYEAYKGGSQDTGNDVAVTWDSLRYYLGYDFLLGSFRPMAEVLYDPARQIQRSSIAIRGLINWGVQPEIGCVSFSDKDSGASDSVIIIGFYSVGGLL